MCVNPRPHSNIFNCVSNNHIENWNWISSYSAFATTNRNAICVATSTRSNLTNIVIFNLKPIAT